MTLSISYEIQASCVFILLYPHLWCLASSHRFNPWPSHLPYLFIKFILSCVIVLPLCSQVLWITGLTWDWSYRTLCHNHGNLCWYNKNKSLDLVTLNFWENKIPWIVSSWTLNMTWKDNKVKIERQIRIILN